MIDNLGCDVALSILTDSATLGLTLGEEVIVKARAKNFNGFGEYSQNSVGGALIVSTPFSPTESPSRVSASSTNTQITVEVADLAENLKGGLPLTAFVIEWNTGGDQELTWTEISNGVGTQVTVTSLVSGSTYKFRYKVANEVGLSDPSPILTTFAGFNPSQVLNTATVLYASDQTLVRVTWDEPTELGGMAIEAYRIYFLDTSSQLHLEIVSCNGETQSIIDSRECLVPLTRLIQEPINLV